MAIGFVCRDFDFLEKEREMTRMWILTLVFMLSLSNMLSADANGAPRKKKHPPRFGDRDRAAGDPDRRNNVDGAIWNIALLHNKTGEKKDWQYRANNGVLFDSKGAAIGKIQPVKKGESVVTFAKGAPVEGELKIKIIKVGHWKGTLVDMSGQSWLCKLDVVDR